MSSLGALTTTFTPPSGCLASTNLWQIWKTGNWYELLGPPDGNGCMPSNYEAGFTAFYSPGLCPSGYSAASNKTVTIADMKETEQVCCPTLHSFTTQPPERSSDLAPFMSSVLCESQWFSNGVVVTETLTKTTIGEPRASAEVIEISGGWLRANGIVVKFRSGDFDPTSTSSTSSSSSSTSSSEQSSTSSSNGEGGSGGLSSGASIGIGVGVGVIGLAAIIGLVWFLLRMRRNKKQTAGLEPYTHQGYPEWRPPPQAAPLELPTATKYAHDPAPYVHPQELDARAR